MPPPNIIDPEDEPMYSTMTLCFTKDGIVHPEKYDYIRNSKSDSTFVLILTDGSEAAYQQVADAPIAELMQDANISFGIMPTPGLEVRVANAEGEYSHPQYIVNPDHYIQWICNNICPSYLKIYISDITNHNGTRAQLDRKALQQTCYHAYRLWTMYQHAEDALVFPAAVIDRLSRWTYNLTPNTMNITLLRNETGIGSLRYHDDTECLMVDVGGDTFSVNVNVLNHFYGQFILPLFNDLFGRRLKVQVEIAGSERAEDGPMDVTYGELGKLVEELKRYTITSVINSDHPIPQNDLLEIAKRAHIDAPGCIWPAKDEVFTEFLATNMAALVPGLDERGETPNPKPD